MTLLERKEEGLRVMVLTGELGERLIDGQRACENDIPFSSLDVPVHVLDANRMPSKGLKRRLY